jgi:hypothetical protein
MSQSCRNISAQSERIERQAIRPAATRRGAFTGDPYGTHRSLINNLIYNRFLRFLLAPLLRRLLFGAWERMHPTRQAAFARSSCLFLTHCIWWRLCRQAYRRNVHVPPNPGIINFDPRAAC